MNYIYIYSDQDHIPFYVGKGSGSRYLISKHVNGPNKFLTNKIRKVGEQNIGIMFLNEGASDDQISSWERYWIKFIGRRDKGEGTLCNLTDGGEGISGAIRSPELRKHLSSRVKEAWRKRGGHSTESIQKMIEKRTGTKRTEETKQKMSKAAKQRWANSGGMSEESRLKISAANKGKPSWLKGKTLPEDLKKKMGLKNKGKVLSAETRQKISAIHKGKTISLETRQKMCKAAQARCADENIYSRMCEAQQTRRQKEKNDKLKISNIGGEQHASFT